jgi:heme A synthase
MGLDISRLARATNLATVGFLVAMGGFLVTSPLHPQVGDSHGGLMAVFPGALLLIFAPLIYALGTWLNRRGYVTSLISIFIAGTTIVTVVALSSG